jgi:hypothetical protein
LCVVNVGHIDSEVGKEYIFHIFCSPAWKQHLSKKSCRNTTCVNTVSQL